MQGWYADPYGQAPLRWWDGYAWTTYTMTAPPPRDPRVDVAKERRWAPWAKRGIVLFPVLVLLTAFWEMVLFDPTIHSMRAAFSSMVPTFAPDGTMLPPPPVPMGLYELGAFLLTGLFLVAIVPFTIWFYRTVVAAKAVQLAAPRNPLWAIFGWFVPIVEFWFPYQFARNATLPNSPLRRTLKPWWIAYVVGSILGTGVLVMNEFNHDVAVGLAFASVIPAVIFAVLTFRIIDKFGDEHEQLLAADLDPQLVPVS